MHPLAKFLLSTMMFYASVVSASDRSPIDLSGWAVSIDGVPVCSDPALDFAKREVKCQSDVVKRDEAAQLQETQLVQELAEKLSRQQIEGLKQVQRQCRSDASYATVLGSALRYDVKRNVCVEKVSAREQPCPDCPIIVRSAKPAAPVESR